jgi:hypothetical protein
MNTLTPFTNQEDRYHQGQRDTLILDGVTVLVCVPGLGVASQRKAWKIAERKVGNAAMEWVAVTSCTVRMGGAIERGTLAGFAGDTRRGYDIKC